MISLTPLVCSMVMTTGFLKGDFGFGKMDASRTFPPTCRLPDWFPVLAFMAGDG